MIKYQDQRMIMCKVYQIGPLYTGGVVEFTAVKRKNLKIELKIFLPKSG